MYEMKDEYLTGIEQIDAEHKRLFEIAEEAYQLSKDELLHDKYDQIIALLTELKDYTLTHFEHEEAYMEEKAYKRRLSQKVQHDEFRQKLIEMTDDISQLEVSNDEQEELIEGMLHFLTDWLVGHILHMDKKIGETISQTSGSGDPS